MYCRLKIPHFSGLLNRYPVSVQHVTETVLKLNSDCRFGELHNVIRLCINYSNLSAMVFNVNDILN